MTPPKFAVEAKKTKIADEPAVAEKTSKTP